MALKYVDSNAVGAGTGADWANAYTTLTLAFAGMVAGDTAYVAHNHAESTASAVTLTSPGTAASPCLVLCVSSAGTVPPVSADLRTTATITTTGASAITLAGYAYFYGIIFNVGSGAVGSGIAFTTTGRMYFKSCAMIKVGTTAGISTLGNSGAAPTDIIFDNTTVQFGNAGDSLAFRSCLFTWKNTPLAITGATLPAILFQSSIAITSNIMVEGVDLSALASGKTLVNAIAGPMKFYFKDCKLGASVAIALAQTAPGAAEVFLTRCDSGDTNYRHERHNYMGAQTVETTIVRTGGASDGVTPIAWKIITTANTEWHTPFECLPIPVWNETVDSPITVTVHGIWGGGAVPNNDEIWIEVEHLGTSGFPLGNFAISGKADILATAAALSTSAEVWGGSTTAFKMEVTFTPREKGPLTIYVKAAKVSSTFYVCPEAVLS